MRILLDENIPRRFMSALAQHEVFTVADMGWKNSKNGKLLAISEGIFDAIITADKSIQYQNNFTVTQLSDRGSFQAVGLVTDAELFLRSLAKELSR